jgi:hypothetical protein
MGNARPADARRGWVQGARQGGDGGVEAREGVVGEGDLAGGVVGAAVVANVEPQRLEQFPQDRWRDGR